MATNKPDATTDRTMGWSPEIHAADLADREQPFARSGDAGPPSGVTHAPSAASAQEKLVRDAYDYLPHRVAEAGERYGLLAAKLDEEYAEVKSAAIGSPEFVSELGDLIEVCYALGGEEKVERARLAKRAERGGFDKLLVMRLEDRTDK